MINKRRGRDMTEYEQIIKQAKEQNLNFDDKHILIPGCDENRFCLNGNHCFGRIFRDIGMAVLLRDVDCQYSETGFTKEPFVYRIVDKYKTYLPNSLGHYLVEFYVIE
jgi:hypothetical protein